MHALGQKIGPRSSWHLRGKSCTLSAHTAGRTVGTIPPGNTRQVMGACRVGSPDTGDPSLTGVSPSVPGVAPLSEGSGREEVGTVRKNLG